MNYRFAQVIANYLQDTLDQFTADLAIEPQSLQAYTTRFQAEGYLVRQERHIRDIDVLNKNRYDASIFDEEEQEEQGYSSEDGIRRLGPPGVNLCRNAIRTYSADSALELEQQPLQFAQETSHNNDDNNNIDSDTNQQSAKRSPTKCKILCRHLDGNREIEVTGHRRAHRLRNDTRN